MHTNGSKIMDDRQCVVLLFGSSVSAVPRAGTFGAECQIRSSGWPVPRHAQRRMPSCHARRFPATPKNSGQSEFLLPCINT